MTTTLLTHRPATADTPLPSAPVRHSRRAAVGLALVPVVATAGAYVAAGVAQLSTISTTIVVAAALTMCAAFGLVVLRARGRQDLWRRPSPNQLRAAAWLLPLATTTVAVLVTSPPNAVVAAVPGLLWLSAAAAVNEEVWFRGLVLDRLRGRGARFAVGGSAVLFAVLHLANLTGGKSLTYAALQLGFAALFGLVAAELTVLTGSLWPAVLWHFAWDAANYLSGDELTGSALVGLGVCVVLLTGYARWLWVRLPRAAA